MTTLSLPPAIDAGFLTLVLHRAGMARTVRVTGVAVEHAFATVLSHVFRLRLAYDGSRDGDDGGAPGGPATLILKAGLPERPGGPWMGGRHEVAFYKDIAGATPAGLLPRCFDAHHEPESGAWRLLLEDLGASHRVATQWPLPPGMAQCERIVRARARFQAAWWDDPRLGTMIGQWQDTSALDQAMHELAARFAHFADDLGDRLGNARRERYLRLFDAAPRLLARYRTHRHMTVVQGDAHVWNCFLPLAEGVDDARLFDWDAWRVDVGADDLAYMMALHWYPDMRHQRERHLLDCYHAELAARGVRGYDRGALHDDYRLSVLWQIATPVWQHAHGIPPVIWWNHLERIHLAADDLGCDALLAG